MFLYTIFAIIFTAERVKETPSLSPANDSVNHFYINMIIIHFVDKYKYLHEMTRRYEVFSFWLKSQQVRYWKYNYFFYFIYLYFIIYSPLRHVN